jgi:hypothetical protein
MTEHPLAFGVSLAGLDQSVVVRKGCCKHGQAAYVLSVLLSLRLTTVGLTTVQSPDAQVSG